MSSQRARWDDQLAILSLLSSLISISNLEDLLDSVVMGTPRLVNSVGCSIYLRPELVPFYNGELLDGNLQSVSTDDLNNEFIVLAATSRPDAEKLVGKAFYTPNDGLGGWVYAHGATLRVNDCSDPDELRVIAPELRWTDKYKGSQYYYQEGDKRPTLIVPLAAHTGNIGIIKFPATIDKGPFSKSDEDIAVIVAQIVANSLEKTLVIRDQDRHIRHLLDIGATRNPEEVFAAVTQRLGDMLGSSCCQLYLCDSTGIRVHLMFESGQQVQPEKSTSYLRGDNLIGWILRTGKPLLIRDAHEYVSGNRLDDKALEYISDGPPIDEEDRYLRWSPHTASGSINNPVPFLAVPVKASDGSVLGVLCAACPLGRINRRTQPFTSDDLLIAQSFAGTLALAIANERERQLGALLTQLGYDWNLQVLLDIVARRISRLVSGTGCCIYLVEPTDNTRLKLAKTSRANLAKDGKIANIVYRIGEGKTGFCGSSRAILVVNHYGTGEASRLAMSKEWHRVKSNYRQDMLDWLLDEAGHRVGIVQMRWNARVSVQARRNFTSMARQLRLSAESGLPSPKTNTYSELGSPPSRSFVAVPIQSETGDLFGVITFGRSVEKSPFSNRDVALLESIANRLASILVNNKLQEQRRQLLMSLAHEINTPLQGVLADTENLMYEIAAESDLQELAKHNLEQVLRLHLLTETIMAVLSEQTPEREFSVHSIYRPLKDACDMFRSEATAKGCDILEPQPIQHSRFPDIEMSLFDLTIAFKNLIHNAVKYSFRPPRYLDTNRYVRVTTRWVDENQYSISIENYGVGVSREEIESRSIFLPFVRGEKASDRRRTGAGLGLAHARQIIEDLHHGYLEVASKPVSGEAHLTTFIVILPIRQPASTSSMTKQR